MAKKPLKSLLLIFILLPIMLIVCGTIWWQSATQAPGNDKTAVRFVIDNGKGATQIANDLYKKGLIKSPLAFKFYVQLTGRAKAIEAGEFEIPNNLSLFEVLDKLASGPLELLVTIPEGLRSEEIVERFIKGLEVPALEQEAFRTQFLDSAVDGYMYPETYFFPRDTNGATVAKRMKKLFDEKVSGDLSSEIKAGKLDLNDAIILASIVERETRTDEERPVVAGILINRLNIGMALQADASVQYAVANKNCKLNVKKCTNWWSPPTLEDLKINSPFNTYKFAGLPPSPISNPGYSSIVAVLNPTKTDYLYYIHEENGQIHYAKTLAEHNANISKYLGR
jgi:UPF0755 protein